jgi:hypothetical protein
MATDDSKNKLFEFPPPDGKGVRAPERRPIKARTVAVRADNAWEIDVLAPLLPPGFTITGWINETTCAIGAPDFINLSVDDAYQRVDSMLGSLIAAMHIYTPNTRRSYRADQVNTSYEPSWQTATKRTSITVNECGSADALAKQATLLLHLAGTDEDVKKALGLVCVEDPGWGAVYDVIKFVEKTPVALGHETEIERHRQTANHYRHLGEKPKPLPANPPTLGDARQFTFGLLLREWLDQRLKS